MDLIRKISRNTLLLLVPAALISAFFELKKLPVSIVIGGVLGLINVMALAWSVEGTLGMRGANVRTLFFSQFRLVIVLLLIAILAYAGLVTLTGILIGFSIVFLQVLLVGIRHSGLKKDK
jgi:hypothetical protein